MKERDWYSGYVRPAFHRPAERVVCWKTQDMFRKGQPDMMLCARGIVLQLELKFVDALPAKYDNTKIFNLGLTSEQRILLEEWFQAGGASGVLLGVGDGTAIYLGWHRARESWTHTQILSFAENGHWSFRWKGKGPERSLKELPRFLASGALHDCSVARGVFPG